MSSEKANQEKAALDERENYAEEQRQIDLVKNVNARIQNPLHGIPRDQLLAQVEEFTREKGFDEFILLFQKGALIAQNPKGFESCDLLDEEDKPILRREITHK